MMIIDDAIFYCSYNNYYANTWFICTMFIFLAFFWISFAYSVLTATKFQFSHPSYVRFHLSSNTHPHSLISNKEKLSLSYSPQYRELFRNWRLIRTHQCNLYGAAIEYATNCTESGRLVVERIRHSKSQLQLWSSSLLKAQLPTPDFATGCGSNFPIFQNIGASMNDSKLNMATLM